MKKATHVDPIETYLTDICTVPVNIAGLPGVSIPCGFNQKGMPIGMQLIGRSFGEAQILNAAYKYQQAAPEKFIDTKWVLSCEIRISFGF